MVYTHVVYIHVSDAQVQFRGRRQYCCFCTPFYMVSFPVSTPQLFIPSFHSTASREVDKGSGMEAAVFEEHIKDSSLLQSCEASL